MNQTDRAIALGVAYLQSVQGRDGSFVTQVSPDDSFVRRRNLLTVFGPALILTALSRIDAAQPVRDRLATWLRRQKNPDGSFNYWAKGAPERQTRPYPNDLDDTCCAWMGLYLHNPELLDSTALAQVVRLLLTAEQTVGGPYKTWLVGEGQPAWQDVDLAVNANISYLLRSVAEPLPNLQKMMGEAIKSSDYGSPYYPVSLIVLYYLARAYQGEWRTDLVKYILQKQKDGYWQTPAQTALAVSALRHLGYKASGKARRYLIKQQRADGSWPAEPIWLDEKHGSDLRYAGSAALTTALVLDALLPVKRAVTASRAVPQDAAVRPVVRRVQKRLNEFDEPLRQQSQRMLAKLVQSTSGHEIVLLPQMFGAALKRAPWLPPLFYDRLSAANIFGWMAYTIYDDFLDGEGDLSQLPVANMAMRESLAFFRQALPRPAFLDCVGNLFTRIDTANAWEVAHCRFEHDGKTVLIQKVPHYKSLIFLAERSIGHGLAPLAVLAVQGLQLDDPRVILFEKGFCHYLTARQLNDDLHDWQQDFERGQISYVVAHLLRAINYPVGSRQSMAGLTRQLQQAFWRDSLPLLCQTVTRQIQLSRQAYARSQLLTSQNQFLELLDRLESAMARTLLERQKAVAFLKAYTR